MNSEQIIQAINELRANGGDLSAITDCVTTLASSNKTPLGLNQWQRSDKPVMEDFNEDNRIIDETLRALQSENTALRAELAKKVNGIGNLLWSLSDIGLQQGTETIESICAAMPNYSLLILSVGDGSNRTQYPNSLNGMLIVWKFYNFRMNLEFKGANVNRKFMGTYYNESFSGWVELATI